MQTKQLLKDSGFILGRMISPSKSWYRTENPNSICYFNANVITAKDGKIWYGDLDLTKDGEKLKEIAKETGEIIYVLTEFEGRFDNEEKSSVELIPKAVWDTTQDIPFR